MITIIPYLFASVSIIIIYFIIKRSTKRGEENMIIFLSELEPYKLYEIVKTSEYLQRMIDNIIEVSYLLENEKRKEIKNDNQD